MNPRAQRAADPLEPPPHHGWPTRAELARLFRFGSGPLVARTFHRALALLFLTAFVSLGLQLDVLVGSRGLLPAAGAIADVSAKSVSFFDFPSVFKWFGAADETLRTAYYAGVALSLLALFGLGTRLCFVLLTILYASFVRVTDSFLAFQWDNLLVECGALAVFLPRHRAARWIHLLLLGLLFKLMFESGLAKWQSHLRDWHDGSAMTFYYETAPIPAWLAWHAHNLPRAWHLMESRMALELELIVPFFVFGPRLLRLAALGAFTGFQLINVATANYGFFVYLALALHLFLLDDADLERVWAWVRRVVLRRRAARLAPTPRALPSWRVVVAFFTAVAVSTIWLAVSLRKGSDQFARGRSWPPDAPPLLAGWEEAPRAPFQWHGQREFEAFARYTGPLHLVNNYHLFGHITRERPEPEFEVRSGGETAPWLPLVMFYKAGPLDRAPPYVAPHQPRVDFLLWFYGLGHRAGAPRWVRALVDRLCRDPAAVQALFTTPLPAAPDEVRIVFWRYRFTTPEEHTKTGNYWKREGIASTAPRRCR